jgi:hypothetical protein
MDRPRAFVSQPGCSSVRFVRRSSGIWIGDRDRLATASAALDAAGTRAASISMMLAPIFGSHGAEALLRALQPRSADGDRDFSLRAPAPRFKNDADLHKWVVDLVRMDRPPEIQPGILACAAVRWGRKFVVPGETATRYALKSSVFHVVVATNPEDSTAAAIAEGRSTYQYFRLDYDEQQLGPLFKEPAPHIHIMVDGEPRFPACRMPAALPIADFVDFIFRKLPSR